jgi:hydroxymethylbilane synthase
MTYFTLVFLKILQIASINLYLRIGTRASNLALAQTELFITQLLQHFGDSITYEIIPIKTTGDDIQDRPLYDIGGKNLFVKEIHIALLEDRIDCAVHSLKDLEAKSIEGIEIACVLPRGDVRDILITKTPNHYDLKTLPKDAKIGTCAPRRIAQVKMHRPDCQTMLLRGNIETRIQKFMESNWHSIILAKAGLDRLNMISHTAFNDYPLFAYPISIDVIIPAAGQGAVAIDCLNARKDIKELLQAIDDAQTRKAIKHEREYIENLNATCHTPVGAYFDGTQLHTFLGDDI